MRATVFRLAALLAVVAGLSCRAAFPPFGGPQGTVPQARPGMPEQQRDSSYSVLESRRVADKRSPDVLLDTYHWWCSVPQTAWNQTRVGDSVRCLWHPPRI